MPDLPPPFDPDHYRRLHADVRGLDDAAAAAHYAAIGRAEGRIASPLARREDLLARVAAARSVLEIGPFCRPLVTGPHVEYLDILDAPALRARAIQIGLDPAGCPETIHHVGPLRQVDRRYDAVVSSHAIEHQPDLVRHLEEVARILDPGGCFYLVVPDKRFCFDHFQAESSIAEVIEAWQSERTTHGLARVIDHGALATHNDAARHWRGDHGAPLPEDRARRIRDALAHHDRAQGAYLDVHGWYFTPDSFRTILATLAELGLSAFDAAVYDTPRDRMEFCTVLQRRRPPRRTPTRNHGMDILFFQTADPFGYAPMLAATQPNVIEYCRRQGFRYESFVGIRRGPWNWQASFNRIAQYKDLLDAGFTGWGIYLDADAWIHDLDFDLPAYLADKADRAAILATSGVTGAAWDINDGITLINLGHPQGRALVQRWWQAFQAISDERLAAARAWIDTDNDQDLIQRILRDDPVIAGAVLIESMDVINSRHARFIRQHLRAQTADLATRIRSIAAEVQATFRIDGLGQAAAGGSGAAAAAILDDRGRWTLQHPVAHEPRLEEAPVPPPRPDIAIRLIAAWRATADRPPVAAYQADFAAALDRGDAAAVAADLAALGRSPVAQGILGGARQHRLAATDPAFAYRRALRTYDALVSLAEATGAATFENPELGPWGERGATPPAALFKGVESALGVDLSPPPQIGGYLGIAVGRDIVLHLRMVEAIHAAWRLHQVRALLGLSTVLEIGGGAGLTAFYARRLPGGRHLLADSPVLNTVQGHVLADGTVDVLPVAALDRLPGGSVDLLFNEDTLPDLPSAEAITLLRQARALGVRAILSVNQEAAPTSDSPRATMRDLVAQAGGFRLAQRQRHALRPGFAEELFVATE